MLRLFKSCNFFNLKNFLGDERQLWVYIIAKWRKPVMTHYQYQSIWKKREI